MANSIDRDVALYLAQLATADQPPIQAGSPQAARRRHEESAAAMGEPREAVESTHEERIDGVPLRVFVPVAAQGVVVYLHGGGWVTGTLDSYDPFCRALANRAAATVVSVGYSLAPEARYPVQVNEAMRVLEWVAQGSLGGPVALAGDSAGAYLALRCGVEAGARGLSSCAQALFYPVVDPALDTESARLRARGYRLETETMRWYWDQFLPDLGEAPASIFDEDLGRSPASLILTAGFDPLRDEGIRLAAALREAGTPVCHSDYPSLPHGFLRMRGFVPAARPALDLVGTFLRRSTDAV